LHNKESLFWSSPFPKKKRRESKKRGAPRSGGVMEVVSLFPSVFPPDLAPPFLRPFSGAVVLRKDSLDLPQKEAGGENTREKREEVPAIEGFFQMIDRSNKETATPFCSFSFFPCFFLRLCSSGG
jgi:hypothetical protein